jgi:hypothetical protein
MVLQRYGRVARFPTRQLSQGGEPRRRLASWSVEMIQGDGRRWLEAGFVSARVINDIAEILERKIEEWHASLSLPLMMMLNTLLWWKER